MSLVQHGSSWSQLGNAGSVGGSILHRTWIGGNKVSNHIYISLSPGHKGFLAINKHDTDGSHFRCDAANSGTDRKGCSRDKFSKQDYPARAKANSLKVKRTIFGVGVHLPEWYTQPIYLRRQIVDLTSCIHSLLQTCDFSRTWNLKYIILISR